MTHTTQSREGTMPTLYYVFEWDSGNGGWYDAAKAIKVYRSRAAAEKFAASRYVVRSQAYVKGATTAGETKS